MKREGHSTPTTNPPRVEPRNLLDFGVGDGHWFPSDRGRWTAQINIVNITDKEALYNFLSTFSGTHFVAPRAVTLTLGLVF